MKYKARKLSQKRVRFKRIREYSHDFSHDYTPSAKKTKYSHDYNIPSKKTKHCHQLDDEEMTEEYNAYNLDFY